MRNCFNLLALAAFLLTLTGCPGVMDGSGGSGGGWVYPTRPASDSDSDNEPDEDEDDEEDDSNNDNPSDDGDEPDDEDDSNDEPDEEDPDEEVECADEEFTNMNGDTEEACSYPVVVGLGGDTYVSAGSGEVDLSFALEVEGPVASLVGFNVSAESVSGPGGWMGSHLGGLTTLSGDPVDFGCFGDACSWTFLSKEFIDWAIEEAGENVPEDQVEYYEMADEFLRAMIEIFVGDFDSVVLYNGGREEIELTLEMFGTLEEDAQMEWSVDGLIWFDGESYKDFSQEKIFVADLTVSQEAQITGLNETRTVTFEAQDVVDEDPVEEDEEVNNFAFYYNPPGDSADLDVYVTVIMPDGTWPVTWEHVASVNNVTSITIDQGDVPEFANLPEGAEVLVNVDIDGGWPSGGNGCTGSSLHGGWTAYWPNTAGSQAWPISNGAGGCNTYMKAGETSNPGFNYSPY